MPSFSPFVRLAAKSLYELGGKRSCECIAQVLEVSPTLMDSALAALAGSGVVTVTGTARYPRYSAGAALACDYAGTAVCGHEGQQKMASCFQLQEAGNCLESSALLCERIDHFLDRSSSVAAVACLELLIRYLKEWRHGDGGESDRERFIELALCAADTSMYLTVFHHQARDLVVRARTLALGMGDRRTGALCQLVNACLENMAAECSALRLSLLRGECMKTLGELGDTDAITQYQYFYGMFHFWEGNFTAVLTTFEEAGRHPQIWKGRFQTEMFPLYTSSAAVYTGHFHRAVGILDSARRTAELTQNLFKALWWEAQLAMVLLYMNRCEEALELIDHVITEASEDVETKIYIWGLRGLAYYHFRKGELKAAHQALGEAMLAGRRNGMNRPIYSYPWMFEMLYAFQRQGLRPIPGLVLKDELARALEGPNKHLRAAALRMGAVISLHAGAAPGQVFADLQQSLSLFEEVGNPLEASRTRLHMAECLVRQGHASQAASLRAEALQVLAFFEQPEGDAVSPRPPGVAEPWLPVAGRQESRPAAEKQTGTAAVSVGHVTEAAVGGLSVPPRVGAGAEEDLAENCRSAMESIPFWRDVKQFLHQLTHIACCELGAERAVLFRIRESGTLEAKATCNVSSAELGTGVLAATLLRMLPQLHGVPALLENDEYVSLVVPLNSEPDFIWLLYLESTYALRALRAVSPECLTRVAQLFSRELRTALRHTRKENRGGAGREQPKPVPYQDSPETLYHGSPVMRQLISKSRQVAATDAPVLILGETGVGKELLARYIHDCSGRAGAFVPVHPASIPENLFESEFFGHEKGAFTGAHKQKTGLAEIADGGTLFIDEVADIPMATQVKLLRVFQERRFMRVGGRIELCSEFRLVGATNKNLWQEVQAGRFREDLYYRMSVVPLTLPPLRERKEDIPILVKLFLTRFARRYHRSIALPTAHDLAALASYPWPGNVRELKSVVERAVILYRGGALHYGLEPCPEAPPCTDTPPTAPLSQEITADLPTLDELQRRYVQHVLHMTGGKVSGPGGALAILGVKRSTFYAKFTPSGHSGRK